MTPETTFSLSAPRGPRWVRSLAAAALLLGAPLLAEDAPSPAGGPVTMLPKMTVVGQMLKDYPLFPKKDVKAPGFADSSPPLDLFYPGKAYNEGVTEGDATVGVMLDEKGRPTDFLLLRYTKQYFGEALLEQARQQDYAPRRVKGVAVPGRFNFSYRFVPTIILELNSFNAIEERTQEIEGGPRMIYEPHLERELDGGGLASTAGAVALLPAGYEAPKGKVVKAFVSFYVDETGRVRLPNVESAASPLLIPNALKAVAHWHFQPPTVKGKPVLVFTLWTVTFVAAAAVSPAPGP
jgi:hypothetical protein